MDKIKKEWIRRLMNAIDINVRDACRLFEMWKPVITKEGKLTVEEIVDSMIRK